ncbi:putative fe-s oxidoreductase [hydrocarbon metagenome]|uniref:Putative fe-s oxidoreductase n=1 Tax=hydrocarbon metagenome TaxID=938273 RepID=A0A0W8E5M2_9ZZZZ
MGNPGDVKQVRKDNEIGQWGMKRYHSLNYHLREKFGQKVFKIPLDAGLTCPNRDGTLSTGGCDFCSLRGSGDFAGDRSKTVEEQFEQIKDIMHRKWAKGKYIAYYQAFTNTYAPVERLKYLYELALKQSGVVGLAVATRPDCLPDEVIDLLEEINQKTYLWVELGLQTIHERTSRAMNLQYCCQDFDDALNRLRARGIETCTHMILGLPGESIDDMKETGRRIAGMDIQGLKIHMLHLMKETPLEAKYEQHPFPFLEQSEYVDLVIDLLEILPARIVIHRLTGDSPRDLLIGPTWSLNKWEVLNQIDHRMIERNTWQGKYIEAGNSLEY